MSALPWDAPACTCPAVECVCPTAERDRHCPVHGDYEAVTDAVTFDPECPEHAITDPSPASGPEDVTMWCEPCRGPQVVVDEFDEQIGFEAHAVNVRVRALDCGHEEVYDRRYPGHPDFDPSDAQLAAFGLIVGAP